MRYRIADILSTEAVDTPGTKTISIKIDQPISRIEIYWQLTKANVAGTSIAHNAADLTKIELVDGSDVLFSLNGYEAMALNIYDRKVPTMCRGGHLVNQEERIVVGIDFGRYLWDELLALVPARFTNLQLKITFTLTSSDEDAEAGYIGVKGYVFDEKVISPIGFLMAKEHYSYTPSSTTAYEHIDLPTDYPYRKLLVRAFEDGSEPYDSVTEARLDEDNLKRVPFDWDMSEFVYQMRGVWLPVEETFVVKIPTAGCTQYVTCTDYLYDIHVAQLSPGMGNIYFTAYSGGKLTFAADVAGTVVGGVLGYAPNHCLEFPFGAPDDIEDWYDVTTKGSVRLRLKAGSGGTSSLNQVFIQQLRRY